MSKRSSAFSACDRWRLAAAASAAIISGCTFFGVRLSGAARDGGSAEQVTQPTTDGRTGEAGPDGEYDLITAINREEVAKRLAEKTAHAAPALGVPEDRREALSQAVEVSIAALLGSPDPMVAFQQRHGAQLNSTMLRAWVDQLHVWDMLDSVSNEGAADLELYRRSVEVPDERFAWIQSLAVQDAEFGRRMNVQQGSEEWPYAALVWKLSAWQPASGYLRDTEGEALKDGSSGRTVHITIPARFQQGGAGLLRVNFYWDLERGYWVPHIAMMGASESGGKTSPMLMF